ncbi:hypothetical protein ACOMHN_003280 [Nucella lapillus]
MAGKPSLLQPRHQRALAFPGRQYVCVNTGINMQCFPMRLNTPLPAVRMLFLPLAIPQHSPPLPTSSLHPLLITSAQHLFLTVVSPVWNDI